MLRYGLVITLFVDIDDKNIHHANFKKIWLTFFIWCVIIISWEIIPTSMVFHTVVIFLYIMLCSHKDEILKY